MAIQVSGTTVINDSRQLQNIASVDATTVAALGTAGVGGATSLITGWTNIPNSSTWSLTLSASYDIIKIYMNYVGTAGTGFIDLYHRFNYSGGTETGNYYAYAYDTGASGGAQTNSGSIFSAVDGLSESVPSVATGEIEVKFHGDSSRFTQWRSSFVASKTTTGGDRNVRIVQGHVHNPSTARVHTGMYFFNNYGVNYSGGQYLMLGITL